MDFPIEYHMAYLMPSAEDGQAAAFPPPPATQAADTAAAATASSTPFPTWHDAFRAPGFAWYGVGDDGQTKHPTTWYSVNSPKPEDLSFDVSNNQLGASILSNGTVRAASVLTRVGPASYKENSLRGVFAHREMIGAGPWQIKIRGVEWPERMVSPGPRVDLLDGLFPVFRWQQGQARVEVLYFAPVDPRTPARQPRALLAIVRVTNTGTSRLQGTMDIEGAPALSADLPTGTRSAYVSLEDPATADSGPAFELPPGESLVRSFAFLLGAHAAELKETAARVQQQTSLAWLNETRTWRLNQLGTLTIPDNPQIAEMFVRYIELCRQSVFYQPDGTFGAGGLGADCHLPPVENVWMRDTFYQILAMTQWQPQLAADAIPFFLRYGMPPKAYGRGTKRFPGAGPVTHSLSNALTPFVLAGAYYQATGDKEFLKAHPELLATAKERFRDMLASRPDENVFLFPSMYISDGDARGDYHTGTNAFALAALRSMARVAGEVYGEKELASEWAALADRVQSDLLKRCAGPSPDGWRFFEGANADGTFVEGHDGEESDIALLPFYGLLEADDPAIVNHSRLSLTPQNPMYEPVVDGVLWVDGKEEFPATFPAWVSAMGGARDEAELQASLDRVVHRTDLNGVPWWWPYAKARPAGGLKAVTRRYGTGPVTQSGWAAGVFVCKFVNDVLGLQVDVPARRASFRPFTPWQAFDWQGASLGSAQFDVRSHQDSDQLTATMTNRNPLPYECTVELVLPPQTEVKALRVEGKPVSEIPFATRYGRPSVRVAKTVSNGQSLTVDVDLRPVSKP